MNIWRYNACSTRNTRPVSAHVNRLPSCHYFPCALTIKTRHDAAVFYRHARPGPFGGGKLHRDCIIRGQEARSHSLLFAETADAVQTTSQRLSCIQPRQCRQQLPLMRPFNLLPDYAGSTHTRRLPSSYYLHPRRDNVHVRNDAPGGTARCHCPDHYTARLPFRDLPVINPLNTELNPICQ